MTTFKSAKALVEHLKETGFKVRLPIDVDEIAKKLDIDVVYSFNLNNSGVVGQIEFNNKKPTITVSKTENTYEPRRRFTIAHEIAHYCLHADKNKHFVDTRKNMSRSGSYWDTYEFEANVFAAQLLMPKNLIIKKGKEIVEDYSAESNGKRISASKFVDKMATLFQVSNPAMEYRLKNIGIL